MQEKEHEVNSNESNRTADDFDLSYSDLGGGKRVVNKKKYIPVGYEGYTNESVAQIHTDGTITFFLEDIPDTVRTEIEDYSADAIKRNLFTVEKNIRRMNVLLPHRKANSCHRKSLPPSTEKTMKSGNTRCGPPQPGTVSLIRISSIVIPSISSSQAGTMCNHNPVNGCTGFCTLPAISMKRSIPLKQIFLPVS
jgi:hypothetical protein